MAHSPLPEHCCAQCAHGIPEKIAAALRTMITCKAVPPSVVAIQTQQGLGFQARFPQMDEGNWCGLFAPKNPNPSN